MVVKYIAQGMRRDTALFIAEMSKHQFYYERKAAKSTGRPRSTHTLKDAVSVNNSVVVDRIKLLQEDPDLSCGYKRMTKALQLEGFVINHKKTARIMKDEQLSKRKKTPKKQKEYAQYRKVKPEAPLRVLEMDIKLIYIAQNKAYAQILTIIDTFTRVVLHWQVGMQMTQYQVKSAIDELVIDYLQPEDLLQKEIHIELRNDNGPQFCAKQVRQHFEDNHIAQVFTHPYTPQENGHVESFHSILKTSLADQAFYKVTDLEDRLKVFYEKYNYQRIHGSAAGLPPMMFWQCWDMKLIEKTAISKRRTKFNLKIPHHQISEKLSQREASCSIDSPLDGVGQSDLQSEERNSPSQKGGEFKSPNYQPSDQRSPSVASC